MATTHFPNGKVRLAGQSIVGYSRAAGGGKEFRGFNPKTNVFLAPTYFSASSDDIENAVRLAAEAFATFGQYKPNQRARFLQLIAEKLEYAAEELIDRAVEETALPSDRIEGELKRTCFQLRFFSEIVQEGSWVDARIDHADPFRQPFPKPDVRSMLKPLGPIAVFCASNFPLAFSVAGTDTASALAAANPTIVLAHYSHPGTAELAGLAITHAASELGLPEGVFSLLYDAGQDVGQALVAHPQIQGAGFTGSRSGGITLMKIAAARARPIPVFAEMSSVNPAFILPNALKIRAETLASGLHASAVLGVGQFCTNPGVVITLGDNSQLVSHFSDLMANTPPGIMLNSRISSAYRQSVSERMQVPHVSACKVQKYATEAGENCCQSGTALFQTDAKSWLNDRKLQDEIFGPSTLMVSTERRDELLEIARSLDGNLTATIHGSEEELRDYADLVGILETKVGRVIFNGYPTGVEVCHAMVHGGAYPATSDGRSTSVGGRAPLRFTRPVCYQNFPDAALPDELKSSNPLRICRLVDGHVRLPDVPQPGR